MVNRQLLRLGPRLGPKLGPKLGSLLAILALALGCEPSLPPEPTQLPTAASAPTPDLEATAPARWQATIAALPTAIPLPTQTPTPTPLPTPTPRPTATPAPTPTPPLVVGGVVLEPTPENLPLILLMEAHRQLGNRVAAFPWVTDGVNREESAIVSAFRDLAAQDAELAAQVIGMPFLLIRPHRGSAEAIRALTALQKDFPKDVELLQKQEWFRDGLAGNELPFLTVLQSHAYLRVLQLFGPDDFKSLAVQNYGVEAKTRDISLPLAGDIQLISFNNAASWQRCRTNNWLISALPVNRPGPRRPGPSGTCPRNSSAN